MRKQDMVEGEGYFCLESFSLDEYLIFCRRQMQLSWSYHPPAETPPHLLRYEMSVAAKEEARRDHQSHLFWLLINGETVNIKVVKDHPDLWEWVQNHPRKQVGLWQVRLGKGLELVDMAG